MFQIFFFNYKCILYNEKRTEFLFGTRSQLLSILFFFLGICFKILTIVFFKRKKKPFRFQEIIIQGISQLLLIVFFQNFDNVDDSITYLNEKSLNFQDMGNTKNLKQKRWELLPILLSANSFFFGNKISSFILFPQQVLGASLVLQSFLSSSLRLIEYAPLL